MSAVRGHSRATSAKLFGAIGLIALTTASAAAQVGSVVGTVRQAGGPVVNARAILDKTLEMRTDSAGRFQFHDVAVGRHTLDVLAIGATPYGVNLIVAAKDTLEFDVSLVKTVTLDSVLIEGSSVRQAFARAYEDRKRVALGKYMDSTEMKKFGVVRQALLFIPGVRANSKKQDMVFFTNNGGELCEPNVWIDAQNWGLDQGVLSTMRPDDIVAVEVYTRGVVPDEFKARGLERGCGALVLWTKRLWPRGKGR